MKAHFIKSRNGAIYPYDEETRLYIKRRKPGTIIKSEISQCRNYKFHKKMFSLFKLLHDYFPDPDPVTFRGETIQPEKSFDGTREYLVIMAGYYEIIGLPNGKVKVKAKSLAYDSMDEENFNKVYSAVIDAGLKSLPAHWSDIEKDRVANQILNYV